MRTVENEKWKFNRMIFRKSTVNIKKTAKSTVHQPEGVRLKSQKRKNQPYKYQESAPETRRYQKTEETSKTYTIPEHRRLYNNKERPDEEKIYYNFNYYTVFLGRFVLAAVSFCCKPVEQLPAEPADQQL